MPTSLERRVGVIGAGIVGLATARAIARRRPDARVTVIDKEARVGAHQTGHNSGVVHAGVYYRPGSLKAELCRSGIGMLRAYCHERGLPYEECGKVIVAVGDGEVPRLDELERRGRANGVEGLRRLGPFELRGIEPHVVGRAGLLSPRTAITDFRAVAAALADDVRAAGGEVALDATVTGIDERYDAVRVTTTRGYWQFGSLVVCAGLQADLLARLSGGGADPRVVPFRGEYWLLRPERRDLVRGLVYPVPDPRYPFLGVHLTRRVDGEVLIGPNAVLALAREGYRMSDVRPRDVAMTLAWPGFLRFARRHWRTGLLELHRSLRRGAFVRSVQRYVPDLRAEDVVRGPSGVRAQAIGASGTLIDDFRITRRGRVVDVRNAPSPAATSALAIAEHVVDLTDA